MCEPTMALTSLRNSSTQYALSWKCGIFSQRPTPPVEWADRTVQSHADAASPTFRGGTPARLGWLRAAAELGVQYAGPPVDGDDSVRPGVSAPTVQINPSLDCTGGRGDSSGGPTDPGAVQVRYAAQALRRARSSSNEINRIAKAVQGRFSQEGPLPSGYRGRPFRLHRSSAPPIDKRRATRACARYDRKGRTLCQTPTEDRKSVSRALRYRYHGPL